MLPRKIGSASLLLLLLPFTQQTMQQVAEAIMIPQTPRVIPMIDSTMENHFLYVDIMVYVV